MTVPAAEKVATWEQALELLALRNECRGFMTRDTSEIGEARQRVFFRGELAPGKARAWLLREDGAAVAYGMLREDGGHLWLSCGVAGHARGRGLGSMIVRLVTAEAGVPVRLEVRRDNAAARRVYEKAGYRHAGQVTAAGRVADLMEHA